MMNQPDWSGNAGTIDKSASDGVMIALIPTVTIWFKTNCPHLTLVYVGKVEDLNPTLFNELGKETSDLAVLTRPFNLRVTGIEEFGEGTIDNPKVEVFTMESTPELRALRRSVEHWDASDWPFNPHVTIGPRGTVVENRPEILRFDRLMVRWGQQELIFSLTGGA